MKYFVYILQNPEGKLYIGQTNNLERRIEEHNNPNYTKSYYTKRIKGPWKLIYKEEYNTRSEAMLRERYLKSGTGRRWIKKNICRASGC